MNMRYPAKADIAGSPVRLDLPHFIDSGDIPAIPGCAATDARTRLKDASS